MEVLQLLTRKREVSLSPKLFGDRRINTMFQDFVSSTKWINWARISWQLSKALKTGLEQIPQLWFCLLERSRVSKGYTICWIENLSFGLVKNWARSSP